MPGIDIFNNDAFSLSQLTAAINDQPYVPGRISALGLFSEEGVTTTTVQIEKDGEALMLVEAKPRGGDGQVVSGSKRSLMPFNTIHLPQRSTILADEIQGLRAFGSETELESVQAVVNKRLAKHRVQLDATHEWHRIGAIKGQVLDRDGTVLIDLFAQFGIAQQTLSFALGNDATVVRSKIGQMLDMIEDALGAVNFTSVRVFCGRVFWDLLTNHESVRETYLNTQQAAALRGDPRDSFDFGGATFERYRGKNGATPYVADNEAYAVPEGITDLMITRFAPGDYMETVNTSGLPYYSRQEPLRLSKGVELESQSNPLHLNTRPRTSIKLTVA
jgi:hypothetical protein